MKTRDCFTKDSLWANVLDRERISICCDQMSKALGNEIICNEDEQPYLALQYVSIYENDIHHSVIPISFCPFCGRRIEFIKGSNSLM